MTLVVSLRDVLTKVPREGQEGLLGILAVLAVGVRSKGWKAVSMVNGEA